jgi:hypothetical protein
MSDKDSDRFDRIDTAIDKIRTEVDDAAESGKSAGSKATKEVREAIDALEQKVDNFRDQDS